MRRVAGSLGAAVLVIASLLFTVAPASSLPTQQRCVTPPPVSPVSVPTADFLTGGGFILHFGAHANFGVGGGCKEGGDGHGLWGHLEYIDHGIGLNVHWNSITAYLSDPNDSSARYICGTATTNSPPHVPPIPAMVNFAVRAADHDAPGQVDQFDIRLTIPNGSGGVFEVYFTGDETANFPHPLVGGNITLHKPNPSTMGPITMEPLLVDSCPAFFPVGSIMIM